MDAPPPNRFAGAHLDRASRLRQDRAWLRTALLDPRSLFVPVHEERVLIGTLEAPAARFLQRREAEAAGLVPDSDNTVFLGLHEDRALFALHLEAPTGALPGEFVPLREVGLALPERDAAVMAYAKAMLGWRREARFCSRSGEALSVHDGGHVLVSPGGGRVFPRVDPAVIVLVSHSGRCLLGRKAEWSDGRYSTIAGFVEPGESLEDAVAREVHEETNVAVTGLRYHGSQPWPFPSSLMLGFLARAVTTDVRCNDGELADARWFSRGELASGRVRLPGALSISYRLIESWYNEHDGPPLAEVLARGGRRNAAGGDR